MLLFYRILIWLALLFEGASAIGILSTPLGEPANPWGMQFLYSTIGYLLFEVLFWFGKKLRLEFSPHIFLWLVAALAHAIPGTIYGLITNYPPYYQIAHFTLMGFFLMIVMHDISRSVLKKYGLTNRFVVLCIALCATLSVGVLNELIEYFLVLLNPNPATYSMMLADPLDTANDLLMNTLGATLAGIILLLKRPPMGSTSVK